MDLQFRIANIEINQKELHIKGDAKNIQQLVMDVLQNKKSITSILLLV
jgi:hypothetical protein